MLGAHGGMHQKWHNAYEETVRVPLVVSNPVRFPTAARTERLTSHIDLAPTLLGLAGADAAELQRRLRETHRVVRPLVGRDLSALLRGREPDAAPAEVLDEECVYFMSDDQVSDNGSWLELGALKLPYRPVIQPGYVETVVARLAGAPGLGPALWKYSRYFDGRSEAKRRQPDEHELYCLTDDPLETRNLAHPSHKTAASEQARARLDELLLRCRAERRLTAAT